MCLTLPCMLTVSVRRLGRRFRRNFRAGPIARMDPRADNRQRQTQASNEDQGAKSRDDRSRLASADLIEAYRLASATAKRVRKRESWKAKAPKRYSEKDRWQGDQREGSPWNGSDAAFFERSSPRQDGERKAQNDQDRYSGLPGSNPAPFAWQSRTQDRFPIIRKPIPTAAVAMPPIISRGRDT